MKKAFIMTMLALCCALRMRCTSQQEPVAGGTGSEIIGRAVYQSLDSSAAAPAAIPVMHGSVYLYPVNFIPDTSFASHAPDPITFTDTDGFFRVLEVVPDSYCVEVDESAGKACIAYVTLNARDSVADAGVLAVAPVATRDFALGAQAIQALDTASRAECYVRMYGTRLAMHQQVNLISFSVHLNSVPNGAKNHVNILITQPFHMSLTSYVEVSAPDTLTPIISPVR